MVGTPGNKAAKKALRGVAPPPASKSGNKPLIWVESAFHQRKTAAPGSANWHVYESGARYLQYVCPCGCGEWRNLPVKEGDKVGGAWHWDGNLTAPTIKPSIQHVAHEPDDCKWHGYVTNGEWVTV